MQRHATFCVYMYTCVHDKCLPCVIFSLLVSVKVRKAEEGKNCACLCCLLFCYLLLVQQRTVLGITGGVYPKA